MPAKRTAGVGRGGPLKCSLFMLADRPSNFKLSDEHTGIHYRDPQSKPGDATAVLLFAVLAPVGWISVHRQIDGGLVYDPEHFWILVCDLVLSVVVLVMNSTPTHKLEPKCPPLNQLVCSVDLDLCDRFRLAVDMKFPIHIHIHIHRFFRGYPWEYPWIYP